MSCYPPGLMLFGFSEVSGQIGPGCSQTITNFKWDVQGPQKPVENPYQSFWLAWVAIGYVACDCLCVLLYICVFVTCGCLMNMSESSNLELQSRCPLTKLVPVLKLIW